MTEISSAYKKPLQAVSDELRVDMWVRCCSGSGRRAEQNRKESDKVSMVGAAPTSEMAAAGVEDAGGVGHGLFKWV